MSACAGCHHQGNRFAKPVQLADGGACCCHCELWRRECYERHVEAQKLLRFSSKEARLDYLARVEEERGKVARDRLAAETMRIWESRRAARTVSPETACA
jgi:hypothetical protein